MRYAARCRIALAIVILLLATPILRAQSHATQPSIPPAASGAQGLDAAITKLHAPTRNTAPLSPQQSLAKLKPAPGLAVDLIAAEPIVRQPLCINFDGRGRIWVTQYIQYPVPAGLRITEYDNYLRAKFDKIPKPPPNHDPGHDRITIHEDVDADGSFSKVTTFVDGLNLVTSALPDRDGVWVLNPPYLLYYPDENHDDIPDGNPIVHLSGFGLEDTHAVASSLTFGPDGWIYGAHGSTCTSKVKAELSGDTKTTDFLGQAIWRYHPTKHQFEIFAEGGGNTFGVAFDAAGRLFSGTNWGNFRGLHYVQGGYYIKNWGKHGPLTNPYAFGYFDHMPHTGDAQRLTHTFAVYNGGLLPQKYEGALIGPNPLMSRVQVTRLDPIGSTYKTTELDPMLTSDDGWFRPVDAKVGPDGAIYIADFYENRISHVDPRDNWDRSNGRIYRIRPADWKPGLKRFDVAKMSNVELTQLLDHDNSVMRGFARRELVKRGPTSEPHLPFHQPMDAFWIFLATQNNPTPELANPDPAIRAWAIRRIGDERPHIADPGPFDQASLPNLLNIASTEEDPQVRSQLAATAKRLPAELCFGILKTMLARDQDAKDPFIPLQLWWALEANAVSHRAEFLSLFATSELWRKPIVRDTILRRLARRWAADPTPENQSALLELIHLAPGDAERKILFAGINEAFEGREIRGLIPALADALAKSGDPELALRGGDPSAHQAALQLIADEDPKLAKRRLHTIDLLSQVGKPEAAPALLNVAQATQSDAIRCAAIAALARFDDPTLGSKLVALYAKVNDRAGRAATITALISRPVWARTLLTAIGSGTIARADISASQIQRLRQSDDAALVAQTEKLFGKAQQPTSEEKQKEIDRIRRVVSSAHGDPAVGKSIFTTRCATCHTLFAEGGHIGPDLTGYDRRNLDFLLPSIVDPSAYIREEFTTFRLKTTDHRTLEGLITERGESQITITDSAGAKTIVPRSLLLEERALSISLMPEDLLVGLPDRELRDLFAYLMK